MRTSWIASAMFLMAVAGCEDAAVETVDAGAADAGVDGDGVPAVAVAAPVAARELQDPPMLVELTGMSGRLAMVVGLADGGGTGRIARVGDGDGPVVMRRAHRATEDEQALLGKAVTVYDACTANVTALVEVASLWPADGSRHRTAALWRIAEERSGVHVVAELSDAPGCDDPIFADELRTDRVAAKPVLAGEAETAAAMARLRAMPRFAEAQAAYQAAQYDYDAKHPDWSESAELVVHELTLDGTAYVTAELNRDGNCGGFGAIMFAVWQRSADGGLRLVLDSDMAPAGYDLAFDDDHDGVPELAATSELEAVYEEQEFEGCGC